MELDAGSRRNYPMPEINLPTSRPHEPCGLFTWCPMKNTLTWAQIFPLAVKIPLRTNTNGQVERERHNDRSIWVFTTGEI